MVTGSHIPFDRNGLKLGRPAGELLKEHEAPLLAAAARVRDQEYARLSTQSMFDKHGMLRPEHLRPLPPEDPDARERYVQRYVGAFPAGRLSGRRILVWQHSAVGRDILAKVLESLGAEVARAGWSDAFVAVDTEAVDAGMIQAAQDLVDANGGSTVHAVVSTDGDSDRPLVLAVENGTVRFVPGDLLGLVAAEYLGVRHVAVPVSANDAISLRCAERGIETATTRIGSPFVVAAMREIGWEPNGGLLTAITVRVPDGGTLEALPTRDALLPILTALFASLGRGQSLGALMDSLPRRFGASARIKDFPAASGREIMRWLSPTDAGTLDARFDQGDAPLPPEIQTIRERIERAFASADGFPPPQKVNWLDGVRIEFTNRDVVHLRPSGNAPEMRCYATADTQARAETLAALATGDPGIVRRLEREAAERLALVSYRESPRAVLLHGAVQPYAWGGYAYIPGLLGQENPASKPFAELWMGAHPRAPALAEIEGARVPLDRLIASDPWKTLGPDVALRYAGRLPYLFKVLDVRIMASIQAHPSKTQAEEGFARENAAGIPIDAAERTYRDDNHKPEAHVALTDFWMLHGFRPLPEIAECLLSEPELSGVMPSFGEASARARDAEARSALLRDLYARVMTMAHHEIDAMLDPLLARLEAEELNGTLHRDAPGFWALRAARSFPLPGGHRDRGIISIYLMNLLHLKPGQGTFQPSGTLHAYLEGANVELMANSDNVLRGGLTPKHVDVPELLQTLLFNDGRPTIMEGRTVSETGQEYETPASEFALERIDIAQGVPYSGGREHSADTLVVIDGAAALIAAGRTLMLPRGSVALVPAGIAYSVAARAPRALLFKAGVPEVSSAPGR
jgi:mannose-6-phosphate isomerase class I